MPALSFGARGNWDGRGSEPKLAEAGQAQIQGGLDRSGEEPGLVVQGKPRLSDSGVSSNERDTSARWERPGCRARGRRKMSLAGSLWILKAHSYGKQWTDVQHFHLYIYFEMGFEVVCPGFRRSVGKTASCPVSGFGGSGLSPSRANLWSAGGNLKVPGYGGSPGQRISNLIDNFNGKLRATVYIWSEIETGTQSMQVLAGRPRWGSRVQAQVGTKARQPRKWLLESPKTTDAQAYAVWELVPAFVQISLFFLFSECF